MKLIWAVILTVPYVLLRYNEIGELITNIPLLIIVWIVFLLIHFLTGYFLNIIIGRKGGYEVIANRELPEVKIHGDYNKDPETAYKERMTERRSNLWAVVVLVSMITACAFVDGFINNAWPLVLYSFIMPIITANLWALGVVTTYNYKL